MDPAGLPRRSRRSRGWKICRTFARCCEWVGRRSTSIASCSPRFPNGSRSTSTTRSTRCTGASNCGCSTPTMMSTDFSPSWCSTARAASSPPCFVLPRGQAARRSSPSCAGCCARSEPIGPTPRSGSRADSHYCSPEVLDWCRASGLDTILGVAPTATLRRHVADLEASTKARFEAAPGTASFVVSRNSSTAHKVGAASSGSSLASKSARKGPIPASSSPTCKSATLARCTKTSIADAARPKTTSSPGNASGATHAPGRRPISSVSSSTLAPPLSLPPPLAPTPHQDRRLRRRNEDDDPRALADLLPRAGYSAFRSRTHTAPRHLNDGARGPTTIHNPSFNPANPL